jgi:hypothetical protein
MEIIQMVKEASEFFQEIEPGVLSAAKVGAALSTAGSTAVKVLQKGKNLVTYWITKPKKPSKEQPEGAPDQDNLAPAILDSSLVTKSDVALLVDINRRMLVDVSYYLAAAGIDADLIIVTNDPLYSSSVQFLEVKTPDEWSEIVHEFAVATNAIKRVAGGAHLHIFLSTPLAMAFGLGSVWGTVDEATVYHWENQTYHPVMKISRGLRQ